MRCKRGCRSSLPGTRRCRRTSMAPTTSTPVSCSSRTRCRIPAVVGRAQAARVPQRDRAHFAEIVGLQQVLDVDAKRKAVISAGSDTCLGAQGTWPHAAELRIHPFRRSRSMAFVHSGLLQRSINLLVFLFEVSRNMVFILAMFYSSLKVKNPKIDIKIWKA